MNKIKIFSLILIIIFSLALATFGSWTTPVDPQSEEILAIKLQNYDLSTGFRFRGESEIRDPLSGAGWMILPEGDSQSPYEVYEEAFPGYIQSWGHVPSNNGIFVKYGYFNSPIDAESGAKSQIGLWYGGGHVDLPSITLDFPSTFPSGKQYGEKSWVWDMSLCSLKTLPGHDNAMLSFTRGKFCVSISVATSRDLGTANKEVLEFLAGKIDNKIITFQGLKDLKITKDSLAQAGQINNQGITNSLNKKIDHIMENFKKGKYQTALNELNSLVNELSAQRGKHVSEQAYQKLKGYADIIVTNVTVLMQP